MRISRFFIIYETFYVKLKGENTVKGRINHEMYYWIRQSWSKI